MLTTNATNLPRLMNCNGSRNMPPSFASVDPDPTARDEGNAAHWVAQGWFDYGREFANDLIGTKAYNGVVITSEMIEHVGEYLSEIELGAMEVETSFGTDLWRVNARADHISWNATTSLLTIDDFKYGHRLVEPEQNWTLIAHAIGYTIFNGIVPTTTKLRIHQPRPHHPDGKLREWSISYPQLLDYYARINNTLSNPADELVTGLAWCAKCHALATCPAARAASMNAVDATALTFTDQLPNDVMAFELDTLRNAQGMLTARLEALQELAMHRLKAGEVIEGYGVETQLANTRWKAGITPQALTLASGVDCVKPGAITPAEFKRRGGSQAAYDALTERPITGIKLVRASADKRARRAGLGK